MGFHRQIRTRIDCDGCGDQWQSNLATDADPVFATRAAARRFLITELGWEITVDGMWCSDCVCRRLCQEQSHIWEEYAEDVWVCGTLMPAMRCCRRYDAHLPLAEADGIGHPEYDPGLLTAADQAALTALELSLSACYYHGHER